MSPKRIIEMLVEIPLQENKILVRGNQGLQGLERLAFHEKKQFLRSNEEVTSDHKLGFGGILIQFVFLVKVDHHLLQNEFESLRVFLDEELQGLGILGKSLALRGVCFEEQMIDDYSLKEGRAQKVMLINEFQ